MKAQLIAVAVLAVLSAAGASAQNAPSPKDELAQLRKMMKNPDSFQLKRAFSLRTGDVCFVYTSQNTFGATVQEWAQFDKGGKWVPEGTVCETMDAIDAPGVKTDITKTVTAK